ncbi:MAG TPA: transposase [bacterium]|nr:transposase [bacterium]
MVRPRRIQVKNGYYHLFNRFVNGEKYFREDSDVIQFLSMFKKYAAKFEIKLILYCIMHNHFHILLKLGNGDLSNFLEIFGTNFARWMNKKYNRKGHLWQERHKTKLIDKEKYLKQVALYILNNPKRAGLTNFCELYKWSSAAEIYNNINGFSEPSDILEYYSDTADFLLALNSYQMKDSDIELYSGQFLMDEINKNRILQTIDRRRKKTDFNFEKRKDKLKDKNIKNWQASLEKLKKKLNDTKENQLKYRIKSEHLEWYFLNNKCGKSYEFIRILYGLPRHTTVSSAISRITHCQNKKNAVENILINYL